MFSQGSSVWINVRNECRLIVGHTHLLSIFTQFLVTLCNVLHLLMVTHRLQLDQHTELRRHKVDCVNETSVMALKANVDHYRNSVMCSITNVCDPPTHLSAEPVSPELHCQSHGAVSITAAPLHRCSFMSCSSQAEGSSAEGYVWLPVGIVVVEKWSKCCTQIYSGCVGQN